MSLRACGFRSASQFDPKQSIKLFVYFITQSSLQSTSSEVGKFSSTVRNSTFFSSLFGNGAAEGRMVTQANTIGCNYHFLPSMN